MFRRKGSIKEVSLYMQQTNLISHNNYSKTAVITEFCTTAVDLVSK
jgi:hypothetical protein